MMAQQHVLAFECACEVIRREYAQMDDGVELGERIIKGLRLSFDDPPVEEFEQILHKRFTADEVRVAVFDPMEEQIAFYPMLLAATEAAPEGHALRKLQGLVLSSIFLLHKRHWSFLQEFVVQGGLDALANMLGTQNMYFRGQVIEILTCITDCDVFDWFAPPTTLMSRILHVRMLEMADHGKFLDGLVANRSDSYPGGSARCLQILAFWLSWVRATYTQDKRLHLSPAILEQLEAWSREPEEDEERQLANTLFKDFGTDQYVGYQGSTPAPCISDTSSSSSSSSSRVVEVNDAGVPVAAQLLGGQKTVAGILRPSFDMKSSIEAVHARKSATVNVKCKDLNPPPSSVSPDRLDTVGRDVVLKEKGNGLFKEGNYEEALELYTRALDEVVEGQEGGDEIMAALHYNRAASLWKIAQALKSRETGQGGYQFEVADGDDADGLLGGISGSDAPGVFELLRCEQACREAASLSPGHFKATYRLAAVQLSLGNINGAAETVNGALSYQQERERASRLTLAGDGTGTGTGATAEFPIHALLTLRQRCTAAALARGGAVSEVQEGASSKTMAVLAALQRRRQREEGRATHAWSGSEGGGGGGPGDDNSSDATATVTATATATSNDSHSRSSASVSSGNASSEEQSKKPSTSKAALTKGKGKSQEAKLSTRVVVEGKVEAAEKRRRAMELGQRLKKAVAAFERGIVSTDTVESIMADIWHTDGLTLREALAAYSLEESLLLLLIKTACAWAHSQEDGRKAARLLCELVKCERFSSNLSMALFGNSSVKDELRAAISLIRQRQCQQASDDEFSDQASGLARLVEELKTIM